MNEALIEVIQNFKQKKITNVDIKKVVEEIFKSSFAPSLKDIIGAAKGGNKETLTNDEYIKESDESPKKIIEL